MYLSVKEVKPREDYTLLLTYENGEQRVFDVNPCLNIGIFRELKDKQLFNTVKPSFDTMEWANEADIDPEVLYEESEKLDETEKV